MSAIRCEYCGQFLPYEEQNRSGSYIPDTHFTKETTTHYHIDCLLQFAAALDIEAQIDET